MHNLQLLFAQTINLHDTQLAVLLRGDWRCSALELNRLRVIDGWTYRSFGSSRFRTCRAAEVCSKRSPHAPDSWKDDTRSSRTTATPSRECDTTRGSESACCPRPDMVGLLQGCRRLEYLEEDKTWWVSARGALQKRQRKASTRAFESEHKKAFIRLVQPWSHIHTSPSPQSITNSCRHGCLLSPLWSCLHFITDACGAGCQNKSRSAAFQSSLTLSWFRVLRNFASDIRTWQMSCLAKSGIIAPDRTVMVEEEVSCLLNLFT